MPSAFFIGRNAGPDFEGRGGGEEGEWGHQFSPFHLENVDQLTLLQTVGNMWRVQSSMINSFRNASVGERLC